MRKGYGLPAAMLIALALAGCGKDPKAEAAKDVHGLYVAAQSGDAEAFNAAIDREKLKSDLRNQARDAARLQGIDIGGPSDAALDRMIGPDVLRQVRQAGPGEAPSVEKIAETLRIEDRTRACVPAAAPPACALTFEKQGERWKLVGVQTSGIVLKAGEAD